MGEAGEAGDRILPSKHRGKSADLAQSQITSSGGTLLRGGSSSRTQSS